MNWTDDPARASQIASQTSTAPISHASFDAEPAALDGSPPPGGATSSSKHEIRIHRTGITMLEGDKEVERTVFTMMMGTETIQLLPFKNWGQLDIHKWTVRGKLPGTPAGLDITYDHVKIAGETVSCQDPEGCLKLERAFNEWLKMEQEAARLAREKAHTKPKPSAETGRPPEPQALHFQVEVERAGQVHIKCVQGKETLVAIGLNQSGFANLVSQGLLRKPHSLKVGALHDWVELDGVFFSFEKGRDDSAVLTKVLNEKYLPARGLGQGKDIVVYENAASSTGFDVQFAVLVGGAPDHHRRALNEEALELLQDEHKCGLLQHGLVIKLARPNFIFKLKTPDGGERYLDRTAENTVTVVDDEGQRKLIDLGQPVNYLRLSAVELTAVFNHPAINRHSTASPRGNGHAEGQARLEPQQLPPQPPPAPEAPPVPPAPAPAQPPAPPKAEAGQPDFEKLPPKPMPPAESAHVVAEPSPAPPRQAPPSKPVESPPEPPKPRPNLWLKPVLAQPPIRHDWFTCTMYGRVANQFGNSHQGKFGLSSCWAVAMGDTGEISDPAFKGFFLTEKGGFGFLSQGYLARFHKGVALVGTQDSALEGIGVSLVGVGFTAEELVVFVVTDNYRPKFGVPGPALAQELARLRAQGAVILSVQEVLDSPEPLEWIWTVPAEQQDPNDPQVLETVREEVAPAQP